eukprot:g61174.t1
MILAYLLSFLVLGRATGQPTPEENNRGFEGLWVPKEGFCPLKGQSVVVQTDQLQLHRKTRELFFAGRVQGEGCKGRSNLAGILTHQNYFPHTASLTVEVKPSPQRSLRISSKHQEQVLE